MPTDGLAIAQVTPFAWEAANEVNEYVARVSAELARAGHRVLVLAPSHSPELIRSSRRAIRTGPDQLLERATGDPVVLGVGEVLPFSFARRRAASVPVDVARTLESLLSSVALDVVHVHEPFQPSAASTALRHSRALNVASFHAPTERILSTQLTRPLTRLLFSRLDLRIASYRATAELMQRFFPATYRVITPGAAPVDRAPRAGDELEVLLIATEERAATRTFLRALRTLSRIPGWRATVLSPAPLAAPATLSGQVRERVSFQDATELSQVDALARADVVVLASEGLRVTPGTLVSTIGAGAVPVTSRLPAYEELLGDDTYGLEFEPGDAETLGSQLARLVDDPDLRQSLRASARPLRERLSWSRVAGDLEEVYEELVARRHDGRGDLMLRGRLGSQPLIDVDLHMHTDHSPDCATPVEVLLAEAKARGLGAIAVTDHNEIAGALEARAKAHGIKVIVAEEIKTADQGEVIGLFIEQRIPRGLTLPETIAEIKRQGGLVYVPHPFDRLHAVPDYEHLLPVLDQVDAIEVFNPRVAISEFNEEAARFAAKYRIPAGAGSDAHVPQGLGSVRIRMRDFDGPQEFLESLRAADIIRNPANLFYVQALKFLQTKAMPQAARRAARDRRVRRVTEGRPQEASGRNS
ncbi:MAG: glycosyltransferase [Solirubrobacterales bacterium]|nr:glycosyltransferase [Solirubrobacterales bacterium]MBV9534544.1 glycosyltransferase [Solirubrobacterales bacterium]